MDARSTYFDAQAAIRADAASKAAVIERKYAEMPVSMDMLVMMGRLNQMIGEIADMNAACERQLEKLPKPEGARV